MLGLLLLSILALTSGVLSDPGRDRGGKDGKEEMMKKMMPPISVPCGQGGGFNDENPTVTGWVNSIYSNNSVWFAEKAREKREGKDFFANYATLRTGLQNNICLMRRLAQRQTAPNFCSAYSERDEMECPDMGNMEEVMKMKKMMKGKKMMECKDKDIRRGICKLFQDRKMMQKVEGMIVKDYMKWTDCSDLTSLSQTFFSFWNNPSSWISSEMNNAPTLEKIKMFKECFPKFAAENLGQSCSPFVTSSEITTIQSKPTIPDMTEFERVWNEKKALLEGAKESNPKKFLCLLYYKIRAGRSNLLNINYDKGSFMWFKDEFQKVMKEYKSDIVWNTATTTPPSQNIRNTGDSLRFGTFVPRMPAWEQNGRQPTFQEWKTEMEEKLMLVYYVYTNANENSAAGNEIRQIFEEMFNNMDEDEDYEERLEEAWETYGDTPANVLDMMKAKVETLSRLMNENDRNKKYGMFKKMLMKLIMKEGKKYYMTNPECNTINSQYRNVANYIVNRRWQQLRTQNWLGDLDHKQKWTAQICIANEVYSLLQGSCRNTARQEELRQVVQNESLDKRQMKMQIKSKLMQNRNPTSGQSAYCDLYYLVSASTMDEVEKKMHFGEKLKEIKGMLMEYDDLTSIGQNWQTACPTTSKQIAFSKLTGAMRDHMMKGMRDDYDDEDDMEDMDDEDDMDDEEDMDDEDDMDDDEDDYMDELMERIREMARNRGRGGMGGGMRGGMRGGMGGMRGGMREGMRGGRSGESMGGMSGEERDRRDDKKGGKGKRGEKDMKGHEMLMMKCPAVRRFKTCIDKVTCEVMNEMLGSMNCQAAPNYNAMVSNIDTEWRNVENSGDEFAKEVVEFIKQVKEYEPIFAPCVMKKMVEKLSAYWSMDECATMHLVKELKMKGKRGGSESEDRDDDESYEQPDMGQGQGQGQGQGPQQQNNQFRQGQGFSFNRWRNHMQSGQWNGRNGRGRGF